MTYKQFLNELKERLKRLPLKDRDEALRYYEEYFAEAGTSREELPRFFPIMHLKNLLMQKRQLTEILELYGL